MDCGFRKLDAYSFHLEQNLHGIFWGVTSVRGEKSGLFQITKTCLAGPAVWKAFCKLVIERYLVVFEVDGAVYSSCECGGVQCCKSCFFCACTQSRAVLLPAPPSLGQLKLDSDLKAARHQSCQCKTKMQDYSKANKDMHQSVVTWLFFNKHKSALISWISC